ncbi:unnamed protein product [Phytophthora lilii]|uniref:Unnamed protein product n=1 Tax=Phytophthora lilii TaxID=2077276 RepID=A0A9W6TF48_9STRA|nr:unnamed protein product [Phytophthora lilii]
MESNQAHVNDLHKKFEDLNEEVSAALRVQQDAVANATSVGGRSNLAAARKDALRLAKKTGDWRGDVTALAKHIDLQLQHSRALRSHYAQSLLNTSSQKQQEEAEGSRLRCLRSDLRLLQDFRVRNPEALANDGFGIGNNATTEKDELASWDTQLYISFLLILMLLSWGGNVEIACRHKLQKEKRERLAAKTRNSVVSIAGEGLVSESRAMSPSRSSEVKSEMLVEDAHFTMQKLKREVAELKGTNSKLMLTNSQLEDDLAHLQAKFDEEKRAHLNGKKWFMPKIQKVHLQVLILFIMRDQENRCAHQGWSCLFATQIVPIFSLGVVQENERKDRLVTLAMAARYEMVQLANRQEQLAKEACEQRNILESRAEAELATQKHQLEDAIERLDATDAALSNAKASIAQLQGELRATAQAAAAKETELLAAFEKQQAALQQKLDKTKRELMESMSEMLNLDSRLRKAQEKLTKQATEGSTG